MRLVQNRHGVLSLWPVPMPAADGNTNSWHASHREAAGHAEENWIRMTSSRQEGCYVVHKAIGDIPEPIWPEELKMRDLLELAFRDGRLIDKVEHPAIRALRGA
jgi:hypothetical protein